MTVTTAEKLDVVPGSPECPRAGSPGTDRVVSSADYFVNRTHRDWGRRLGRVTKCDFCNGRSPGVLHECLAKGCPIRICEVCSRLRVWVKRDSKHFINPDLYDWEVPDKEKTNLKDALRKARVKRTPVKKAVRRAREVLPASYSPQDKKRCVRALSIEGSDDDINEGPPSSHNPRVLKRKARTSPADDDGDDEVKEESSISHSQRAKKRSIQALSSDSEGGEVKGESPLHHDPRATKRKAQPSVSQPPLQTLPNLNAGEKRGRLIQVLGIYKEIFGKTFDGVLDKEDYQPTLIPAIWSGPWKPPSSAQQPIPNHTAMGTFPSFEVQHQETISAAAQLLPPPQPPKNYEAYSFAEYPRVNPTNGYHPRENYSTTLRTTPKYHPRNELASFELQVIENDRILLDQMKKAWAENRDIDALKHQYKCLEALQLLWGVFEIRRKKVLVFDGSRTVEWFVRERNHYARDELHQREQGGVENKLKVEA
ncbi:hypothetical protein QBC35DRAFT_382736 [Podospora australis]|uniref:Uncharacterized protein n=1 Tax=Podospora australis TaxID=1536484 RepID=A0AAN7AH24_9PEZI|nr:hypothetical protein QBC35DRAFT_382736 [Podospora australis]